MSNAIGEEYIAQAEANAKKVEQLEAQLAQLRAHVGLVDEAPKVEGFPRTVYRKQETPNPKQIDHPGWDAKVVGDKAAYDKAIADGWEPKVGDFVYPEIEEEVAVVRRVKAKK